MPPERLRREAHPLLLLAMWRLDAKPSSPVLVALQRFSALQAMLTDAEKAFGVAGVGNPSEIHGKFEKNDGLWLIKEGSTSCFTTILGKL
jgi:hypothetical protein